VAIAEELIALLGFKLGSTAPVEKFNDELDKTEKRAKGSTDRMRGLGVAVGAATTAAIALGTAGFRNFAGFEREMTRIGITAGSTAEETAKAGEVIRNLAFDVALPLDQAIAGLDTLVASGMSLEQAMAFLPSVMATAQASGAATTDIANTAQKAASALGLQSSELQKAFDIMVAGGKAGQFELRDMAQFIPELANSFSSLGYTGEEGLKTLIALLQTVREDTGSASGAATQLQNVFGKMFTEETATKFGKFGVDLRAELEAARDAGEGMVDAFVRISNETIKGDLTKLPLLFTDQEFRLGMQSLMTSADSYKKFIDTVNSSEVDGSVMNDLNRVLGDTQTEIDQLSSSWDNFMKAVGGALADPVSGVLDAGTEMFNIGERVAQIRKERGHGDLYSYMAPREFDDAYDIAVQQIEAERLKRQGGSADSGIPASAPPAATVASPPAPAAGASQPAPPPPALPAETGSGWSGGGFSESASTTAGLDAIRARLEGMNSNLAEMAGRAPVDATITDARQDNRQFPVTVNSTVNQTVQQASQAPAAAARATSAAIGQAAVQSRPQVAQSAAAP